MGNLSFIIELIIAELILLFNYPKKKYFYIKALIVFPLTIVIAYFIPMPNNIIMDPLIGFMRFILLLLITILMYLFLFDGKSGAVISGCIAGYALQHMTYQILNSILLIDGLRKYSLIIEIIVYAISYTIIFFTLGRFIRKHNYYENYDRKFIIISALIIFICIFIYRFARLSANDDITTICIALYSLTCCSLALAIQYLAYSFINLRVSNKTLETIISQKESQYKVSKQNMDLLNIKCHDLKHQLNRLPKKEVEEISTLIDIYDNPVETGYDVLNVTMNEKIKILHDKGIKINFLGNGKLLNWISDVDIYSLFGNAIDNAIEALDKVDNKEKKVINISLESKGDLIIITIMNYYNGKLNKDNQGIMTSKNFEKGYHGYGLKSMDYIARKYNGRLNIFTNNNIFKVVVTLIH